MQGKSFGFYALGFVALLAISGLAAFLIGVSHREDISVARLSQPAAATPLELAQEGPERENEGRDRREDRRLQSEGLLASVVPPGSDQLSLTFPAAGIYDNLVQNTSDPAALHHGAIKLPQTGFPWQEGANTYIAGHVLGYVGTGSYMQFAGLPNAGIGDEFYITDAGGNRYTYRVFETLTVSPTDVWVTSPVPGKTVASLQTCVGPNYEYRLVVRGELVSVDAA
ncbi:sortase [Rubrobacter taiwanensis]|jgi:sortase A|uniref:Sortase n=1 Tax=Rubrobacter taiwanensis TaxID=185139 RepID=A0A4R1BJB5_9ACTN|nr:sortase [Rubrobacter taiwanensis]TCJ17381.1 sortase [Rubrobacter taiwanensis]